MCGIRSSLRLLLASNRRRSARLSLRQGQGFWKFSIYIWPFLDEPDAECSLGPKKWLPNTNYHNFDVGINSTYYRRTHVLTWLVTLISPWFCREYRHSHKYLPRLLHFPSFSSLPNDDNDDDDDDVGVYIAQFRLAVQCASVQARPSQDVCGAAHQNDPQRRHVVRRRVRNHGQGRAAASTHVRRSQGRFGCGLTAFSSQIF